MHPEHAHEVRDHWYWRPGWRVGRRFYTWHVTFSDQPSVVDLAARYAPLINRLDGVDPVPAEWLHLTMQGIGFVDEVENEDVDRIVHTARSYCKEIGPLALHVGPAHVDPEAVMMSVSPPDEVRRLRLAIRQSIAAVWGEDGVPEAESPFTPHVSLAYTNTAGSARPIVEALDSFPPASASTSIGSCQLIVLNRDNKMYEWDVYADVPLH